MVVVAVLGSPHFPFKAEHLGPVLTQGAVHLGVAPHHLGHPLDEGAQHQGVVSQVGSLQELHLRVVCRHPLGVLPDPAYQHP